MLNRTLGALEQILTEVDAARPARIVGKRTEFRAVRSEPALLDIRSELAMAAMLARSHIPFDFGLPNRPSPDLHLRDRPLAVEVTAKGPEGVLSLYDELDALLGPYGSVSVHLRFSDFPVRMQSHERQRLIEHIAPLADRIAAGGDGGLCEISFSDNANPTNPITVMGEILPVPGLGLFGTKITLESTGADLGPTMAALEDRVLGVLNDAAKRRQAASVSTVLLVDLARLGNAWLRPLDRWVEMLRSRLPADCPFVGLAVTIADIHTVKLPLAYFITPIATAAEADLVNSLFQDLRTAPTIGGGPESITGSD
jgi:hypothetical protein